MTRNVTLLSDTNEEETGENSDEDEGEDIGESSDEEVERSQRSGRPHVTNTYGVNDSKEVEEGGEILARISLRTLLVKEWKPSYWIFLQPGVLLLYRTKADYLHVRICSFIQPIFYRP